MNLKSQPTDGKFGTFGGKYVPETLMPVVDELEEKYNEIKEERLKKMKNSIRDYQNYYRIMQEDQHQFILRRIFQKNMVEKYILNVKICCMEEPIKSTTVLVRHY